MAPVISVIIPAYNTDQYIARSIQSALNQTFQDIEVIVVDDASTDDTTQVIDRFTDSRLVKIFNSNNLGAGGARNKALKAATGDWIAVLDSDDWYAPERLERLYNVAIENNADIVADDLHLIQDGEDQPWSTLIRESGQVIPTTCLISAVTFVSTSVYGKRGLHLGLSKPLFRRQFLNQFAIQYDDSVKVSQDFWLDMDCLKYGAKFYLIPEPYYYYRARPGSLVNNNRIRHLSDDKRKILEFLVETKNKNDMAELNKYLQSNLKVIKHNLAYYRVVEPWKTGDIRAALKALSQNPGFFQHLFPRLSGILKRRIKYYLLGNKLAFEMMHRSNS